ncbi:MAG TPA: DUF2971 domain-containing protein [Dehalococcoidales bacterium]
MTTKQKSRKLSRYTSLPFLFDLLRNQRLVLLDTLSWADKNDVKVIHEYKTRKNKQVFVLCFCIGDETIHHWRTYADGEWGCCIEFDEEKLLASFRNIKGIRYKDVIYKKVNEVEKGLVKLEDFPFVKRKPYRFENEFRIIWEGSTDQSNFKVKINLNSINKITFSQKMSPEMRNTVLDLLHNQVKHLPKINYSTLYENKRWIKAFKK